MTLSCHRTAFAFLLILLTGVPLFPAGEETARGVVFEDRNRNGVRDAGEPGIAGVAVSNMDAVVRTDPEGRYALPVADQTVLFVVKPARYDVPLDGRMLPQFYHIHQPEGSPAGLAYPGIAPTGPLPASVDFPLYPAAERERFRVIVSGDPQPRDSAEVGYFRDDVIPVMLRDSADVFIGLGDIAYDDLSVYDQLNRAIAQLGIPNYAVHGNHDMNFRAANDRYAAETFRRVYGPEYYSFDYGKVHFVVLDNVFYEGWNAAEGKRGRYTGVITNRQLAWLRNDLALVPDDHLVVLSKHIPVYSPSAPGADLADSSRAALLDVLAGRTALLDWNGHVHVVEAVSVDETLGWSGTPFLSLNAGAACGAWWSGPRDARGIPEAHALDGTPNGYFVFEFAGTDYRYRFVPAGESTAQMRIVAPEGIVTPGAADSVLVNVFNGDDETRVTFRLNDGPERPMARTPRRDPFMLRYLATHRDLIPSWIQDVHVVEHFWAAPLVEAIPAGTHTITVTATDRFGARHVGYRVFEVEP